MRSTHPFLFLRVSLLSFSEDDGTIFLNRTAGVNMSPDLLLSVAAVTIIIYA